jgi:hypothetical protein
MANFVSEDPQPGCDRFGTRDLIGHLQVCRREAASARRSDVNRLRRIVGSALTRARRVCSPIEVFLTLTAIAAANVAVVVIAVRGDDVTRKLPISLADVLSVGWNVLEIAFGLAGAFALIVAASAMPSLLDWLEGREKPRQTAMLDELPPVRAEELDPAA